MGKGQKGLGMDKENRFDQFTRNPQSHAKHRRETFWQITFPLLIGVLLIIAAMAGIIISASQPTSEVSRWADVSLIWIILPAMVFTLILLALLVGLVIGVTILHRRLPRYFSMALFYMQVAREKMRQISDKLAEPVIKTNSIWAAIRRIGKIGKRAIDRG
jgi:FlaA1/EpsC-like NDP-sugar epimerase